jgi:hypothetical protein
VDWADKEGATRLTLIGSMGIMHGGGCYGEYGRVIVVLTCGGVLPWPVLVVVDVHQLPRRAQVCHQWRHALHAHR